jgi:hypothetical protein
MTDPRDRGVLGELIERAAAAGYEAGCHPPRYWPPPDDGTVLGYRRQARAALAALFTAEELDALLWLASDKDCYYAPVEARAARAKLQALRDLSSGEGR